MDAFVIARQILGVGVRIHSADAALAAALENLLSSFADLPAGVDPDFRFTVSRSPESYSLTEEQRVICQSSSTGELLLVLLSRVNALVVDRYTGLAVHAGVVALGDVVVAFPAGTGAGKSTLTAACIQAGFEYLSDEALCIRFEDMKVEAYPRPLQLDRAAMKLLDIEVPSIFASCSEAAIGAAELGGQNAENEACLSHVVFLERKPGPCQLSSVASSLVAARLLDLSFNHYKHPSPSFELVVEQARRVRGFSLTVGNPVEAGQLLRTIAS